MAHLQQWFARLKQVRRKLTPATNQVLLLGIILVLFYARAEGDRLPSFFLYSLAGVFLLGWLWSLGVISRLRYTVSTKVNHAQVGREVVIETSLSNPFFLYAPWVEVSVWVPPGLELRNGGVNHAFSLGRGGQRTFVLRFQCCQRGSYRLGTARVRSGDLFGIFVRERELMVPCIVTVHPRIIPLPRIALLAFHSQGSSVTRRAAEEDFLGPTGVRKYVPGDPVSRVHWRATARTGQLQVKEYDLHASVEAGIFLDLERKSYQGCSADVLETGVTLAASLAAFLSHKRLRYGLVTNGTSVFSRSSGRDPGLLPKILEHLALAETGKGYPFAQTIRLESRNFAPGTTLLLISPRLDKELGVSIKVLRQRGFGVAVLQIGPPLEPPAYLEGVSYFAGISEDNLAQILGGDGNGRYGINPGTG